ncbi:MAG: exodeoxyribonuclease V subunit alpha [Thiotrichaceae bacterium]|nr:exodeoxyribonuclease V subunit alpha [Thiotrichaceae bacterium]
MAMETDHDQSSSIDKALANFLLKRCQCSPIFKQDFARLVRSLSGALTAGHSCLPLQAEDEDTLRESGLVSDDGKLPMVMEYQRLYFQRYWHYEKRLSDQLSTMLDAVVSDQRAVKRILDRYFIATDEIDWQREAALQVSQQNFTMITGGPGTGKTTTVLKILAMLQELAQGELSIALAAPTGKAAMRLQQSLIAGIQSLDCSLKIQASIPQEVSTIHRLLGVKRGSPYFKHRADNPLSADIVVIDEASMVDLALMSKLVDALKPATRLILLGDKDQLTSVESGAVLGDLSLALPKHGAELKKTWRFKQSIKDLAIAINQQDSARAWQLITTEANTERALVTRDLVELIMARRQSYFNTIKSLGYLDSPPSLEQVVGLFDQLQLFQVLCSNRQGRLGVEGINRVVESMLVQQGIASYKPWYSGKPVMITQNDPSNELYNGDMGICLFIESQPMVYFQQANGEIKRLIPSRLPHYETAYALTIHKSQGSEFTEVLVILPEKDSPILVKELIYTAITRAKAVVRIASSEKIFKTAITRKVERHSGLVTRLSSYS